MSGNKFTLSRTRNRDSPPEKHPAAMRFIGTHFLVRLTDDSRAGYRQVSGTTRSARFLRFATCQIQRYYCYSRDEQRFVLVSFHSIPLSTRSLSSHWIRVSIPLKFVIFIPLGGTHSKWSWAWALVSPLGEEHRSSWAPSLELFLNGDVAPSGVNFEKQILCHLVLLYLIFVCKSTLLGFEVDLLEYKDHV